MPASESVFSGRTIIKNYFLLSKSLALHFLYYLVYKSSKTKRNDYLMRNIEREKQAAEIDTKTFNALNI